MPPEASTWRQKHGWTPQEELLAAAVRVVDFWGRLHAVQWGAKPSKLPAPVVIKRPGEEAPAKKKAASIGELAAFFKGTGPRGARTVTQP